MPGKDKHSEDGDESLGTFETLRDEGEHFVHVKQFGKAIESFTKVVIWHNIICLMNLLFFIIFTGQQKLSTCELLNFIVILLKIEELKLQIGLLLVIIVIKYVFGY